MAAQIMSGKFLFITDDNENFIEGFRKYLTSHRETGRADNWIENILQLYSMQFAPFFIWFFPLFMAASV